MQSTSFRLVSAVITLLLLVGLIGVVVVILDTAPRTAFVREQRLLPTVSFSPIDNSTSAAPTRVLTPDAGQHRVASGGFGFTSLLGYDLDLTTTAATLTSKTGAIFLIRGGPPEHLSSSQLADLDTMFDEFVAFYANRDNFQSRNKQRLTVDGASGRMVELVSQSKNQPFVGRIVMAQPASAQLFLLVAVSPVAEWESQAGAAFAQLLASIHFFPLAPTQSAAAPFALPTNAPTPNAGSVAVLRPTATPKLTAKAAVPIVSPPATPFANRPVASAGVRQAQSNWRVYSDGNRVNDLLVLDTMIWAATDGGVSTWNRSNNVYSKFTTLDGLTVNRTTAVVNCPLPGFGLVFGSAQGLQIFEPQREQWKTLNSTNSEMHFDDVSALYCNPEKEFLVVGYAQHGIDVYEVKQGWTLIDQRRGLLQNAVNAVTVIGDQEEIWVASNLGITILTPDGVLVYDRSNTPLDASPVTVMVADAQGQVWLGAGNKVYRIHGDEWTIYSDTYVLASPFPTSAISALALVGDGTLWIGSDTGELCLFDPMAVTCKSFFTPEELASVSGITALSLDARSRLYVATARAGVRLYDGEAWSDYRTPDELLPSNTIHTFAQDVTGLLWIATDAGLYQIDPIAERVLQLFTSADTPYPVEEIVTLFPGPDGGLWVGGKGAGYFDGAQWVSYTTANGLASDQIQVIAGDAQQRIWFGTNAGLSIWNGESFFTLTRADRLPSNNILALQADGENMWIGSDAGLLRFAGNQFQIYTTATTALAGNRITALAKVADGALLIGTDQGLSRQMANKMSIIDETRTYAVTAIGIANNDTVWLGTDGQGLFYFDGEAWTTPPQAVNPPAPAIRALLVDQQGSAWVAGAEGGTIRYFP